VETISWKWSQFWKRTIPGSIFGLIVGLILGLIGGLIDGLNYGLNYVLNYELINMLSVVLICGLIFALVSGLANGFADRIKVGKAFPNQGIKLSIRNSLTAIFITFLTVGTVLGLIFGLRIKLSTGFGTALSTGLSAGLIVGLIVGLNRGGSAVIKHYALRLILWLSGNTPLNFIKFLDHCAKLIFLKKVGGGYIFVHRMLLDYFADLTPQSTKAGDGKTGSAGS
jgi:eukaryotic-like serine/threonine-protein kinase